MLKKFLAVLIIFVGVAFPLFYLISGEITWEMVLKSGIGYIAAISIMSFFARIKEKKHD